MTGFNPPASRNLQADPDVRGALALRRDHVPGGTPGPPRLPGSRAQPGRHGAAGERRSRALAVRQ
jgi:hypothetical protein